MSLIITKLRKMISNFTSNGLVSKRMDVPNDGLRSAFITFY